MGSLAQEIERFPLAPAGAVCFHADRGKCREFDPIILFMDHAVHLRCMRAVAHSEPVMKKSFTNIGDERRRKEEREEPDAPDGDDARDELPVDAGAAAVSG